VAVPVILTLLSIPMGLGLSKVKAIPIIPIAEVVVVGALAVIFTLMLSQTLAAAVDALYERNDLDLLFSSPLKPRRVMTVRFLGVATSVFMTFAYFLGGPLLAIAGLGSPQWLGGLGVLAGAGA